MYTPRTLKEFHGSFYLEQSQYHIYEFEVNRGSQMESQLQLLKQLTSEALVVYRMGYLKG